MVFKMTVPGFLFLVSPNYFSLEKRENMPNVKQLWIEKCFFTIICNHAYKKEHCYEVNSMGYVNSDLFGLANNDAYKYSK